MSLGVSKRESVHTALYEHDAQTRPQVHSSATVHSYGFTPSGVGDRHVTECLSIVTRYTRVCFSKKRRRSSDTAAVALAAAALGYISIQ